MVASKSVDKMVDGREVNYVGIGMVKICVSGTIRVLFHTLLVTSMSLKAFEIAIVK